MAEAEDSRRINARMDNLPPHPTSPISSPSQILSRSPSPFLDVEGTDRDPIRDFAFAVPLPAASLPVPVPNAGAAAQTQPVLMPPPPKAPVFLAPKKVMTTEDIARRAAMISSGQYPKATVPFAPAGRTPLSIEIPPFLATEFPVAGSNEGIEVCLLTRVAVTQSASGPSAVSAPQKPSSIRGDSVIYDDVSSDECPASLSCDESEESMSLPGTPERAGSPLVGNSGKSSPVRGEKEKGTSARTRVPCTPVKVMTLQQVAPWDSSAGPLYTVPFDIVDVASRAADRSISNLSTRTTHSGRQSTSGSYSPLKALDSMLSSASYFPRVSNALLSSTASSARGRNLTAAFDAVLPETPLDLSMREKPAQSTPMDVENALPTSVLSEYEVTNRRGAPGVVSQPVDAAWPTIRLGDEIVMPEIGAAIVTDVSSNASVRMDQ